jgi:cAMP phosphodiesterase
MKGAAIIPFLIFIVYGYPLWSQQRDIPVFKVVPLGVKGGMDEGNLSSYLLAVEGSPDYICLDAGTLYDGIRKAVDSAVFLENPGQVIKKYIKAYLISHAHLDHVAGLVLNSPEDTAKNIYGLPFCLDILKEKYFTWKNWANFANEGDKPALNKYHYTVLSPLTETAIENTSLFVRAFVLSHGNPYQSTAFLIRYENVYFLYLGDTGADETEKTDKLRMLWEYIGPLVKEGKLRAFFLEVSFPDEQPEKQLFGHLTPKLFMQEMQSLASIAGEEAIKRIPIGITHIKPIGNNELLIKKELAERNSLHLNLIFPEQAGVLHF